MLTIRITDGLGEDFMDHSGGVPSVYTWASADSPWPRVPVEGEQVMIGGSNIPVAEVTFSMDGTMTLHFDSGHEGEAPGWHTKLAEQGFELEPA